MYNKKQKLDICDFCKSDEKDEFIFGKFYTEKDISTHYFCMLFSSGLSQNGKDKMGILGFLLPDIKKELLRGSKLYCNYCKKRGATIGCSVKTCREKFHFICGKNKNVLFQFFGQFCAFCDKHRPKQKNSLWMKNSVPTDCCICLEPINIHLKYSALCAPCCLKSGWFHTECIQRMALSAGYFFRCPLCNNKEYFADEMLKYGIYIPEQDASWELVPNAYNDLEFQPHCGASICICNKGRRFTSKNWKIIHCNTCGSQGCHVQCANIKDSQSWTCCDCNQLLSPETSEHRLDASTSTVVQYISETLLLSDKTISDKSPCKQKCEKKRIIIHLNEITQLLFKDNAKFDDHLSDCTYSSLLQTSPSICRLNQSHFNKTAADKKLEMNGSFPDTNSESISQLSDRSEMNPRKKKLDTHSLSEIPTKAYKYNFADVKNQRNFHQSNSLRKYLNMPLCPIIKNIPKVESKNICPNHTHFKRNRNLNSQNKNFKNQMKSRPMHKKMTQLKIFDYIKL